MDSVYSGGLLYEYSLEDNDYGIVEIKNGKVETTKEFDLFKAALKDNPAPTGAGGAATTTHAVKCPTSEAVWQVNPSLVPEMPSQAQKYMKSGAGDGPGLKGGSQDAGDSGTATASVTGGKTSPTSSSGSATQDEEDDDSAGVSVHGTAGSAPFIVTGAALFFTLFGTLLL